MNTRELRIGNFIFNERGIPCNVREIAHYGCVFVGDELLKQDLDNCAPIPLTEELLLKCRVRATIDDLTKYTLPHPRYYISLMKNAVYTDIAKWNDRWFLHVDNFDCATIGCGRFENLHQLQNLYFALTGEELDIKL